MKQLKELSYLLAVNTETIVLLLGAYSVGKWLNENYPKDYNWFAICFPIAMIAILHGWWMLFSVLLKRDKKSADDKNSLIKK